ncbi:lipocalin family protein [Flavobacterium amniphilum]|uniref:lipocalin family protein n=1 Tax=Flavobacterium amniphilum TaxID=1834035 RepID=UPI002029DD1F|nr:lipocalin family protein [Flavobacterium amniphilum]MCL9805736.1 lipocalin family protein [Flavobacterium amniphilum]MCL9806323.1 lipocalin family protein [Flavobacterium amniphilum]
MKRTAVIMVALVVFSCKEKVKLGQIDKIKGYWQITKVETAKGDKKEYPVNENYEYFDIKNNSGFHKKVRWQPMGTFLVDDLQEKMTASEKDGQVVLDFSSDFGKHSEIVAELSDSLLVLESEEGANFHYKKVNVNSLEQYGKKAE